MAFVAFGAFAVPVAFEEPAHRVVESRESQQVVVLALEVDLEVASALVKEEADLTASVSIEIRRYYFKRSSLAMLNTFFPRDVILICHIGSFGQNVRSMFFLDQ